MQVQANYNNSVNVVINKKVKVELMRTMMDIEWIVSLGLMVNYLLINI
jgi:hypothetical protein